MTATGSTTTPRGAWSAYAAWGCAWLFAVPNLYWGLGGRFGADTIGQWATRLTWGSDPLIMAVVLATGVVKVLAGLFALALVRPWARSFPRWAKLIVGWGGAVLLTLYGAVQLAGEAAVATGLTHVADDFDWWAFRWHLFLWSPWFLLWGVLLGLAVWHFQRRSGDAKPA